MKARSFIGDRDTPGNNDDYDPWRKDRTVILGIHGYLDLKMDTEEPLHFTDSVTFKIDEATKRKYTDFDLSVKIPDYEDIDLQSISVGSKDIVFNILRDYIYKYGMDKAVTVELTLSYKKPYDDRKEYSRPITIHPSDQQPIFTKII